MAPFRSADIQQLQSGDFGLPVYNGETGRWKAKGGCYSILLFEVSPKRDDNLVKGVEGADANESLFRVCGYPPKPFETRCQHVSEERVPNAINVIDAHVPVVIAQEATLDFVLTLLQFNMPPPVADAAANLLTRKNKPKVLTDS